MTENLERALQERLLARSQVSARDVEALRHFARTLPARRATWRRPIFGWALAGAAAALAAAVTLPQLLGFLPGPGATPSPTGPSPTQPAPSPSAPAQTPVATPLPTSPLDWHTIGLQIASDSEVIVVIDDPDSLLGGAGTGQGEATMSVRWFDSIVEQVDPSTIRVTWVGFPKDEIVLLELSRGEGGTLVLHFVQDAPPPASDGLGEDRVLVLELAEPVQADDVVVTFDYPA